MIEFDEQLTEEKCPRCSYPLVCILGDLDICYACGWCISSEEKEALNNESYF